MSDIRNVRFRDVTKQNGRDSVRTLYREPLGEIVVRYDNVHKIEKGGVCISYQINGPDIDPTPAPFSLSCWPTCTRACNNVSWGSSVTN